MGSSPSKKKKQNEKNDLNQQQIKLDPNSTNIQQAEPSPKSTFNNSQAVDQEKNIDQQRNNKQQKVFYDASPTQAQKLEDQVPIYINGDLHKVYSTQKSIKLKDNAQLIINQPSINDTNQKIEKQTESSIQNKQQENIKQASPVTTVNVQIKPREKSSTIQSNQVFSNKSETPQSLDQILNRNRNQTVQESKEYQQYQNTSNSIQVASQSDLNLVKYDLLKLVQELKTGDFQLQYDQTLQDKIIGGSGGNFMEGSILDFFSINQPKVVNEKKIQELQDQIRCDTDLLALIKQNFNSNHWKKSISLSPQVNKKHSILNGIPLIRKCDSTNIKDTLEAEESIGIGDDYNLSPISRKQSMQITINTFGDLAISSLAQLEKNQDQVSIIQNSNSDTSMESPKTNTQQFDSNQNQQFSNEEIQNNKEIRLIQKRQSSSVRFMLPNNNLEKIKESDEKEEDMNTKTTQNNISPELKRNLYSKEKKTNTNSSSGILKSVSQDKREESEMTFSQSEESKEDQKEDLIKDYFDNQTDSFIISNFPASNKISSRISEYSSSLKPINTKDLQRTSIFFNQSPQYTDSVNENKQNNSMDDQNSPAIMLERKSPSSSNSDRKSLYLQKRQSAYVKLDNPEKSPPNLLKTSEKLQDKQYLQPNKFLHSNTLQQPQTPTGANSSNISNNNSYITYFNKNPEQSVLETSQVKKQVDEQGYKKINQYTLLQEIGRGGFGKVKLATSEIPTDKGVIKKQFAIKVSNKQKLKRKLFSMKVNAFTLLEREVAIMKKIDHPYLVKLYEVIDDPDDDKIYMVMEFVQKGSIMSNTFWKKDLQQNDPDQYEKIFGGDDDIAHNKKKQEMLPKKLSEEKCKKYFQQFALAIDYMHNFAQIIHRDIKPENILIDEEDNLKIADFGVSHIMETSEDSKINDNAGTKTFTAPEGWSRNFKGKPLDMWAAGATLYYMATGELPFFSKDPNKLKNAILNDEVKFPDDLNHELIDLLKKLLDKNPDTRITASDMLVHPWLTNDGQILLQNSENAQKNIQISLKDLQGAFTKKIHLSTLIRVKFKLNRQLTRARSFLHANQSITNILNDSLNQDRMNTDPNNQSPTKSLPQSPQTSPKDKVLS
ncbi:Serine/Threonine kinase domain protein (macronuclear) [Tetrahymena thermophila SB210]|uniref:Serine/Threonine kinase domain protein n=1 Tax=Tetrahymena thermophila (strain SB210) TaxID=312017 RepID=I7M8C4_TETTS|nr:Serine/Threonine kinase domain protein [Tetrahymena thermophila SB210]EAR97612.2 Serine/Threonine kinase domain protein [Tetrahymena thermophila SB210]|eukprot:XP_001017857.2 Serine/Threonine kinase domain protein [Tetrahymena thermophila SB210]